jgi:hypothetical protein
VLQRCTAAVRGDFAVKRSGNQDLGGGILKPNRQTGTFARFYT